MRCHAWRLAAGCVQVSDNQHMVNKSLFDAVTEAFMLVQMKATRAPGAARNTHPGSAEEVAMRDTELDTMLAGVRATVVSWLAQSELEVDVFAPPSNGEHPNINMRGNNMRDEERAPAVAVAALQAPGRQATVGMPAGVMAEERKRVEQGMVQSMVDRDMADMRALWSDAADNERRIKAMVADSIFDDLIWELAREVDEMEGA